MELREVRRKIFEAPPAPKKSSQPSTTSSSVNVAKENAKNLDLNGNKITLKTSIEPTTTKSYSTNSKVSISLGLQPKEESTKMNSSGVTRRSKLFDDNNNSKTEPEQTKPNGIKLKVNDDEVPALRTRDPADRAARRARRAQQQREMSIDTDSPTPSNSATPEPPKIEEEPTVVVTPKEPVKTTLTPDAPTSVIIEKPKDEKKVEIKLNSGKPTATTSPFKTSNFTFNNKSNSSSSSLTANGGSALRRSVTWGARDKPGAANNIGKALGKFGGQVSRLFFIYNLSHKVEELVQGKGLTVLP